MGKNTHPPRGGGASQKAKASGGNTQAEASKSKPCPAPKGQDSKASSSKSKAAQKAQEDKPVEEAPKKPDTRTLIGGASWTGKLPVNMLSEHCQKQKWGKPEYTMMKTADGFVSSVILRKVNTKTQELTTLAPIRTPPSHRQISAQKTAVEARHFAATYALFRVSSMKNIHMMMPPTYKDLWKGEFAALKAEDVANGRGWMYDADPFGVLKDQEDAKIAAAKKREMQLKDQKPASGPGAIRPGESSKNNDRLKGWTRVPKVELAKRTRMEIEKLLKLNRWNPHSVSISQTTRKQLEDSITRLGFRRAHVKEAIDICKDREEVLEWLLINVPEDDLPKWTFPEGYTAGISLATADLKREGAVKRLASAGYSMDVCEEVYDASKGNEDLAAAALQVRLLGEDDSNQGLSEKLSSSTLNESADQEVWAEELEVLQAIFGDRISISGYACEVGLESADAQRYRTTLRFIPPTKNYPRSLPVLSVKAELPAYIRLSITKQALEWASVEYLGDQMIFNIVDWIEQSLPSIVQDPGPLSDISRGTTTAEAATQAKSERNINRIKRAPRRIEWTPNTALSRDILSSWQSKQGIPQQRKMISGRQSLPAWKYQEKIVSAVNNYRVTIISGETGSGKSTQSVQFVLDDLIQRGLGAAANIICTQPRRISALGLADRVADERCSAVGQEIGYTIRGESKQTPGKTKINFVTTGVLLRRMQTSGGSPQEVVDSIADVSHVVVDEVHERSLDTDFLLVLLKDVLARRQDLKVILMSATLDADMFEQYFRPVGEVARIEIEGRTFPVRDFYLDDVVQMTGFRGLNSEFDEDDGGNASVGATIRSVGMRINYELIAQTVRQIDQDLGSTEGAILIFLPGTMEIDRTIQALRQFPKIHALPLHASLLPFEQKRVFPLAPPGKRKVIASTNVAETSITIADIIAVIDTGRVKETSFDPHSNMVRLAEVWASRAACKQRRGRAGRVQEGICYKLYTRKAEMEQMAERPDPEIRRVPLEQLCLSVKSMGVADVPSFLAGALTPPAATAVEGALKLLRRIGAMDGDELTALGRHLSMIPADLRCAKLMVYGAMFGCLEPCLTIASILTTKSPFVSPMDKRDQAKAARASFGGNQGDLIADLRAFESYSSMREKGISPRDIRAWSGEKFISMQTLNDISSTRAQYLTSLKEIGFLPLRYTSNSPDARSLNGNSSSTSLIRALIAGSLHPQSSRISFPDKKFIAGAAGAIEIDPEAHMIKYFTQENGRVFIHPGSTMFGIQTFPNDSTFLSYWVKMETSKVFVRDVTPFSALTLLLFAGDIKLDTEGRGLVVDDWIRIRGWARIGALIGRLRMMLDGVLAKKIDNPSLDFGSIGEEGKIIGLVRRLVELGGLDS
ncbi:P-loop containing nucleoside triphosphate hydrolase protein [Eremomyces bilateralis CBS 781.70]|uniref:RNA helicase n=1 Tax=Eremomyces bilateralis CBS 781.70 TaxID=1392243 RepID=A0A6G1GCU3_9PEZI|nr:P-loop containing nucleoside triphosphate hydrolase protein [Eremomyces bilateralis CBS 781.70]KAF1815720.1 P-loop containing nucleoside triphosphate hydrolase protein [Eremomyces bilateralis CBS 781.70]